ncbi:CDP-alcohol phosphatidyltransferase family protein [Rhizobium terrae]|uniref:CDP-alcohol phosphatidyltransferase family protein n=1 Tax=Rhizobium terrae TaxID=2171756 RepID=UPI0013C2E087|nr:CDP-alcohol phosphatidyltransferase family protein [Rhizobium terrae]
MQLRQVSPILMSVVDGPNFITFIGGMSAMFACLAAMSGQYALALSLAMWAHVADSVDGWVARRQPHRAVEMRDIGKHLDSFADLLSSGAFPLVFLIAYGGGDLIGLVGGICLCCAGLLRLSYFNVHGLTAGAFVGLPLPHNILVMAACYWGFGSLGILSPQLLGAAAILTSLLHIAPFHFPKMSDGAVCLSILASAIATYSAVAF